MRVGLQAVKGLSTTTIDRILAARRKDAFRDAMDFLMRARPDEAEARALIRCGALDALTSQNGRTGLMWTLARWQRRRDQGAARDPLFARPTKIPLPHLPAEDPLERLRREFAVLGFLCDRHPMELYADLLRSRKTVKGIDLGRWQGRRVRFGGWFVAGKVVHTKQGEPMEFLTFEDETDIVETTFFPEAYHRFCHMLDWGRPYLMTGRVETDWGALTLTVDHVAPLPPLRSLGGGGLRPPPEGSKLMCLPDDNRPPGQGRSVSR